MRSTRAHSGFFPQKGNETCPMNKTSFKKPWKALRAELGITGRFHNFKHTWITNALRGGMNPILVSEISGTSIRVLMSTYLHLSDKDFAKGLEGFEF